MKIDIPTHELERLRRTVTEHPGEVAIRYRGGPLDGMISHTSLESWRWAMFTGWCVRDVHGRVVQILYRRSADHPQVYRVSGAGRRWSVAQAGRRAVVVSCISLQRKGAAMPSAEKIKVACEGCGGSFSAPAQYAGREAKCPKCGGKVRVPAADDPLGLDALADAVAEEVTQHRALTAAGYRPPQAEPQARSTAAATSAVGSRRKRLYAHACRRRS